MQVYGSIETHCMPRINETNVSQFFPTQLMLHCLNFYFQGKFFFVLFI